MAVGTLNVAVTASTRKAQQELQAFRREVKLTGDQAKRSSGDFGGNTIADFTKKFGGGPGGKPIKPPTGDLNTFRSAVVDLTDKTNRYNFAADKQVGLFKGMKQGLGQIKGTLAGATAGIAVFSIGLNFGQKLREIVEGIHSWKDAHQQLMHVITGSTSVQDEYYNRMARLQQVLDIQGQADKERAEAHRREGQAIRDETKALERKLTVLKQGENLTAFQEGVRRAVELRDPYMVQDSRSRFDAGERLREEEERRKAAKEAEENRKDAERERQQKAEQAADRRRQVVNREEKALEELKKQNRQFFMTERERRRDDTMRSIKDPGRQRAAMGQLAELEAAEAAKRRLEFNKNRLKLLRDSGGNSLAATGADSREGFAQRVRFGNQNRVNKIAEDQLTTQRRMEGHLRTISMRPSVELSPANLSSN